MANEVLQLSSRVCFPTIADRAQKVDDSRQVSDRDHPRACRKPASSRCWQPKRYGGRRGRPGGVLRSGPGHLRGLRFHRLGGVGAGSAPVASGAVRRPGPGRRVGRGSDGRSCRRRTRRSGRLTPVDGGYELSGSGGFSSGCDHASWALLGALVVGADGRPVDFMTVLVPRTDYEHPRTCGMSSGCAAPRATRSWSTRRLCPSTERCATTRPHNFAAPAKKVNPGPLYTLPFGTIFTSTVAAPCVGIVAGCYEGYLDVMRERVRLSLGGGRFVRTSSLRLPSRVRRRRSMPRFCRWIAISGRCTNLLSPARSFRSR